MNKMQRNAQETDPDKQTYGQAMREKVLALAVRFDAVQGKELCERYLIQRKARNQEPTKLSAAESFAAGIFGGAFIAVWTPVCASLFGPSEVMSSFGLMLWIFRRSSSVQLSMSPTILGYTLPALVLLIPNISPAFRASCYPPAAE